MRYLVKHPDRLVTKGELLKAVWPDAYVGEEVLNTYIRDLRRVLGDHPKVPQFIETITRRGYRFIALVETSTTPFLHAPFQVSSSNVKNGADAHLVGRVEELRHLHSWLAKALNGERQFIFMTGEPGIGKTTLMEVFLQQVTAMEGIRIRIGWGRCVAYYGAGEAYLPILEALGRLCREAEGEQLIALLRKYAPTWLAQMSALLSDVELEALQRSGTGTTRDRMLREFAEMVEALTMESPLVLALEDLHWCDPSTLDLLSVIAQRRETARLLVLGTYRPADIIVSGHPLKGVKQELQTHRHCEELALGFLRTTEIEQYLAARFPHHQFPDALGRMIHQRTEGNSLFMVTLVESLRARNVIGEYEGQWRLTASLGEVAVSMPESLRQMITGQIEQLTSEEKQLLEVASVAGTRFSAAAVAAGCERSIVQIEEQCEQLVRRNQFLRPDRTAEWPDGTISASYGFIHTLYHEACYERVTAGKRVQLHQKIGEREEQGYRERVGEIAAELALHFDRGRDYRRAVQYLEQAAAKAVQISAHREAITHLTQSLELLKSLPDTPDRPQQELSLQLALGVSLLTTQGYAASQVKNTYARAHELCQQIGETLQLFPALSGLWMFYVTRAELQTARSLAEQLLRMAEQAHNPELLVEAHAALGGTLFYLAELSTSQKHLHQSIELYNSQQYGDHASRYGQDPKVACLSYLAYVFWFLGHPNKALKSSQEALRLAEQLSHTYSRALALDFAAWLSLYRGEQKEAQEHAEALSQLSVEQEFLFWLPDVQVIKGWALRKQGRIDEGIEQMVQGLAAYETTGAGIGTSFRHILLAEAYKENSQTEKGLEELDKAFAIVENHRVPIDEAELYRLKGELLLQSEVKNHQLLAPKRRQKPKHTFKR